MRSSSPLVSVAVTVYNARLFIRETLESIVTQDYPNFEIVISDDASTDITPEILKEYQEKYPHLIRVIFNKINQGVTKNSSTALKACKGKYIALIAGDDVMLPGKLSAQTVVMEQNQNCVICSHDVEAFEHSTNKTLWLKSEKFITKDITVKTLLRNGNQIIGCEPMIRADAIPLHGFNPLFPCVSDFPFFFEILLNGKIIHIDQVFSRYRIHNTSLTGRNDVNKRKLFLFDSLNFYNWILLYHPQYADDAAYFYAKTIRGHVSTLPHVSYPKMQLLSFKIKKNYQSIIGLLVYFLSVGCIKL